MKIIFLDVDGVLNNHQYLTREKSPQPGTYAQIDKSKVELLKQLVEQTGAEIVLTSSWRIMLTDTMAPMDRLTRNLKAALRAHGLDLFDKTMDMLEQREDEIMEWLSRHPEVESFVILDDDASFGWERLRNHWVKTSYYVGLTGELVASSVNVLHGGA